MAQNAQIDSEGTFLMALNGTFYNKNFPYKSDLTPVALPIHNPKGKALQLYGSDYTINTFLEQSFATGKPVNVSAQLHHFHNATVNTTMLKSLIPEFEEIFGANKLLEFTGKYLGKPSTLKYTPDHVTFVSSIAITA